MGRIRVMIAAALFGLCFCNPALAGPLPSFKLFGSSTGWVSMSNHLYWTTSGGKQWTDITPPGASNGTIESVFFLDTSSGWALLASGTDGEQQPSFSLAATTSAGTNWSVAPLTLPTLGPGYPLLGGDGWVDFVDAAHGWIMLKFATNNAVSWGIMLRTTDGGNTWSCVPGQPPMAEHFVFVTPTDGWLAGGPYHELDVTCDGGDTWQEVSLSAPAQIPSPANATAGLPSFRDSTHGLLPVTYDGPWGTALALLTTNDGGKTWRPSALIPSLPGDHGNGEEYPSALTDSTLIAASSFGSAALTCITVAAGNAASSKSAKITTPRNSAVAQLDFVSPTEGWVLIYGGPLFSALVSTTDGGTSWVDITPGPKAEPSRGRPSGPVLIKPLAQGTAGSGGPPRSPAPLSGIHTRNFIKFGENAAQRLATSFISSSIPTAWA